MKGATRSSSRPLRAGRRRWPRGIPAKRAELFLYDAVIFGNIEGDFFTRDQLEMTADFVSRRGGGLLVLGARSFERAGLVGTPLEEVLPLDLTDRRAPATAATTGGASGKRAQSHA